MVNTQQNDRLIYQHIMTELRGVVFCMNSNSAAGPNGIIWYLVQT